MRLQSLQEGPTLTDNSSAKLLSLDIDHHSVNNRSLTTDSAIICPNDNNSNDNSVLIKGLGERWEAVSGWENNKNNLSSTWANEKQVHNASEYSDYGDFNDKLDLLKTNHIEDSLCHPDLIKTGHPEVLDNRPNPDLPSPDCADSEECSACCESRSDCNSSWDDDFDEDLAEEEDDEEEEDCEEDEAEDSYDSLSEPELAALPGFVNPNYPGFQHLARTHPYSCESDDDKSEYLHECCQASPSSPPPLPSPCDTCIRIDKIERDLFSSKEARFRNSLSEEEYTYYLNEPPTDCLQEQSVEDSDSTSNQFTVNTEDQYDKTDNQFTDSLEDPSVSDNSESYDLKTDNQTQDKELQDQFITETKDPFTDKTDNQYHLDTSFCPIEKFEDLDHKELIIRDSSFTDLRESDSDQSSECCCDCSRKEHEESEEVLNQLDRTVPSSPTMEPCKLNIPVPTPADSTAWQPLAKFRRPDHPAHRKREKTEINNHVKKMSSPRPRRATTDGKGELYKIDSVMPEIDLDAIETHLRAAREEERRRRNDREEIRRRLATGDQDDYPNAGRKKPSLQARLQSGMNLQICFMNDVMSDSESPNESPPRSLPVTSPVKSPINPQMLAPSPVKEPRSLNISQPVTSQTSGVEDFSLKCMRLQAEARLALAQAKDVARAHMQRDRRRHTSSPITEMLRNSLSKVGVTLGEGRRRVSRQMLTDMNIAQLQVIVNDMHSQIELLNENLVKFLMERDELHMSQDSMLVDIEDLTRYLGAKENLLKEELAQNDLNQFNNNNNTIGLMTNVKHYHSTPVASQEK